MREYIVGIAGLAVLTTSVAAQIQTSAPGRAPSGTNVQAEVIWNQDYFGGNGYVAQEFGDFPTYNSYHFDDFFTTQSYAVTTLTVPGVEQGNPGANTAVVGRITTEANANATPVMVSVGGFEDAFGNLIIDFGGQVLPPGDYWVTAYVVRDFGVGGQWFWGSTTVMYGSEAYFHNPGGGFGYGGNPIPASVVQGVVADMAFTLEGEPADLGVTIKLASDIPAAVPPGTQFTVSAIIDEGDDQLVPGSPTLHFSFGGGFSSIPLKNVGGDLWEATLPAVDCDDTVSFYLSAEGVEGGVKTLPFNAPDKTFGFLVGEFELDVVGAFNFAAGLPAGWSASGLWAVNDACAPSGDCGQAPWVYYGIPGQCTYNTGAANSGSVTSNSIAIPAGGKVTLSYCSALITENFAPYDAATVRVNGNVVDQPGQSSSWQKRTVDLSAYAGQNVTLEWHFDTVDSIANDFRGWHIDNVEITAEVLVCEGGGECYPDFDNNGVLNLFDFLAFVNTFNAGNPAADCDKNQSLNLFDFLCFNNLFNAGC